MASGVHIQGQDPGQGEVPITIVITCFYCPVFGLHGLPVLYTLLFSLLLVLVLPGLRTAWPTRTVHIITSISIGYWQY